jgi:hypothetical protein
MVVSDKIEAAKNCFNTIKTSGRNNYQKYDYLETRDIFPLVRKVCEDFKMKTNIKPDFELNCFVLTITDKEDNSSEQFFVPYAQITAGDAGKFMQDFGKCQTYAMRYLYIQAFEIAVPDEIDNKDQKKQVPKQKKQPTPKKNVSPVKPVIEKKQSDEVTAESINDIINEAYKKFNNQQLKKLEKDRLPFTWDNAKGIIKDLCRNDAQYNACSQSIRFDTADKV